MINITKGNTAIVYFTGSEQATLTAPYFLFIFTHRVTGDLVKVMAMNVSNTLRYDKFSFIVSDYFGAYDTGMWQYEVREKASDTDFDISGTIVEVGYMFLNPSTPFSPVEYSGTSNTFTDYGL